MSSDPDQSGATGNPLDPRRRPGVSAAPEGQQQSGPAGGAGAVDDRGAPGEAAGTTSTGPRDTDRGGGTGDRGAPAQDAADPDHRRVPPSHPGAQTTDPDPGDTPGLDAGGGVQQGDTPPIESGTSGLSSPQKEGPSRAFSFFVPVGIVALLALAGLALLIGRIAGG